LNGFYDFLNPIDNELKVCVCVIAFYWLYATLICKSYRKGKKAVLLILSLILTLTTRCAYK